MAEIKYVLVTKTQSWMEMAFILKGGYLNVYIYRCEIGRYHWIIHGYIYIYVH